MKVWGEYAAASLAVVAVAAAAVSAVVGPAAAAAVWTGAAAALAIQAVAFAVLVAARGEPKRFLAAWGGGSLLRFVLVALLGLWATRGGALPVAPLLLSAVGFVMLLVLLEPVFLQRGASRK